MGVPMRALLSVVTVMSLLGKAAAFCGFFVAGSDAKLTNNASQVVLVRDGDHTTMTMSNNYQGPPEDFAMVVPVPVVLHKKDVHVLPHDVFDHLDALTAPRLVEYWEQNPCTESGPRFDSFKPSAGCASCGAGVAKSAAPERHGVTIEAKFAVGEYDILILSAKESSGLELWLNENHYKIPEGAAEALAPYVRDMSKFFVAKVNIQKVKRDGQGLVQLSPLRFGYEAHQLKLPVRLGLLNANGQQDLIVYILHAEKRFKAANYPNVFIPTNLEVSDDVRASFPEFYADLFDATLAKHQGKAIVTEYAWESGSCDPCPTPPLSPEDLASFGAKVNAWSFGGGSGGGDLGDLLGGGGGGRVGGIGRGGLSGASGYDPYVITRLHTRYDKTALTEDIVFKEATPVEGGRSAGWGDTGVGAKQVSNSDSNNFQARYVIKHYWTGPLKCKHPHFGTFAGPPDGKEPKTHAARGLAHAKRGAVALPQVVRSPFPELGLLGWPNPHKQPKSEAPAP
jgi:hypothetical protein